MIFAAAEAYNYEDYKLRTIRNFGSIKYIILDVLKIFFTELRLVKPRKMGFTSSTDKEQTELLTINHTLKKQDETTLRKNIIKPILSNIKENYF